MIGSRRRSDPPPSKASKILAMGIVILSLILFVIYVYFWNANGRRAPFNWIMLAMIGFPTAGAIIISRYFHNLAGWAAIGFGFALLVTDSAMEFAQFALITQPGSMPLGGFFAWLSTWSWVISYPFLTALFLLFPTGRTTARIWWLVIAGSVIMTLPIIVSNMISMWSYRGAAILLAEVTPKSRNMLQFTQEQYLVWSPFLVMFITLGLLGMVLRFTNAVDQERQQLKLVALASSLVPLSLSFSIIADFFSDPLLVFIANFINFLSILAFPIAMVVAIFRYRLLDIDFIIRRTLVYSLLTMLLGAIYLTAIILFQEFFTNIFGQQSQVGIVLSTLLIVAISQPLRARIQQAIDRRFFRQKYNAEATFERFTAGLRDEVNLEDLNEQLQVAVEETIQPRSIALWLVSHSDKRAD